MDFSFSGILTDVQRKWDTGNFSKEDVCFSFQEYAFAMLVESVERAVAHTGKNEVVVTGGVAANNRLQEMLHVMMDERGGAAYFCPQQYSGDNGAMIAYTAEQWHEKYDWETGLDEAIKPGWRVDQISFPTS